MLVWEEVGKGNESEGGEGGREGERGMNKRNYLEFFFLLIISLSSSYIANEF